MRSQIRYTSPESTNVMHEILDYIKTLHRRRGMPSSGIVYCRNRAACDAVAEYLHSGGIKAKAYHRGVK
jgi:superfamily II DNA helicase RecQ